MYIALLISGEMRTGVFKEQISFFTRLYNKLKLDGHTIDTYMMIRIEKGEYYLLSEEGLINFNELLQLLNPVYLKFIHNFNDEINAPRYYSQIKMIDMLIDQTKNISYDYFFRIRPDLVLDGYPNFNDFTRDTIYTSVKCDAIGNDQMFIFHSDMLVKWWIPIVRPTLYYIYNVTSNNLTPEYVIFNGSKVIQYINSGIIRDYDKIDSWISYPLNSSNSLKINGYWYNYESYLKLKKNIEYDIFIKKYKEYTGTDIPV